MLDPLPAAPSWLVNLVKPYTNAVGLSALPDHVHEVIFAYLLYQIIETIISPRLSTYWFPETYSKLNPGTKINWDFHVVSMIQSIIINTLAFWVLLTDQERGQMSNPEERIHGYTGALGLLAAFTAGYFVWDLVASTRYFNISGFGLWIHAVSALSICIFGFRPFVNYYAPAFVLYELSTPFLNVHWFCDKLNMTGSTLQWCNGIVLLATFFFSRLVWGSYQSVLVFRDMWLMMDVDRSGPAAGNDDPSSMSKGTYGLQDWHACVEKGASTVAQCEIMQFVHHLSLGVPLWLAVVSLISIVILQSLNVYWLRRMVETVRSRFEGVAQDERKPSRKKR